MNESDNLLIGICGKLCLNSNDFFCRNLNLISSHQHIYKNSFFENDIIFEDVKLDINEEVAISNIKNLLECDTG